MNNWKTGDRVMVDNLGGNGQFAATVVRVYEEDGMFTNKGEVSVLPDGESCTCPVGQYRVHPGTPNAAAEAHFRYCMGVWRKS